MFEQSPVQFPTFCFSLANLIGEMYSEASCPCWEYTLSFIRCTSGWNEQLSISAASFSLRSFSIFSFDSVCI